MALYKNRAGVFKAVSLKSPAQASAPQGMLWALQAEGGGGGGGGRLPGVAILPAAPG